MDAGEDNSLPISDKDRDLAIRTMLGEEGSPDGMAGVASTILNRATSGKFGGKALSDVVLAKGQFEPWMTRSRELLAIPSTDPRYLQAAQIFDGVASGQIPDLTNGATHFYAPGAQSSLGRKAPAWGAGQPSATLGKTQFYSPNGPVNYKAPASTAIAAATGAKSSGSPELDKIIAAGDQDIAAAEAAGNGTLPGEAPRKTIASDPATDPRISGVLKPMGDIADDPRLQGLLKPLPTAHAAPSATPAPSASIEDDPRLSGLLKPIEAAPATSGNSGQYPIGELNGRTISVGFKGEPSPPTNETFDRSAPISRQLAVTAKDAANYVGGQIAGTPGAIAENFGNSVDLARQGIGEMGAGNYAPSFPSADPRTWSVGGALKTALGATGAVFSPVTGVIQKAVEEPVTAASGSPEVGARAGFVANSIAGPLASRAVGAAPAAIANKLVGGMSSEDAVLADLAKNKFGIPINAGQMSASPATKFALSTLNRLPLSGAGADTSNIQNAFNRAVSRTFGEDAGKITPNVMDAAKKRLGNEFDTIANSTNTKVDSQFVQEIHSALNDATSVLGKDNIEPLVSQIKRVYDVIDPKTGVISGDSYQALTRKGTPLDKIMSSNDPNMRFYAGQIRDALDGAMQRSAPPDIVNRLSQARSQYKAMKTIEDLVEKSPSGDISPAALMTPVRGSYGNMAYNGGGDLGDLARIGQRFLKEPPSSGTSERLANMNMLQKAGAAGAGIFGLHQIAPGLIEGVSSNPVATAASIPVSLLAGRVVGSGLRSNWLANTMLNKSLGRVAPIPIGTRDLIPAIGAGASSPGLFNKFVQPPGPSNP